MKPAARKGDHVMIYNRSYGGDLIREGWATIVQVVDPDFCGAPRCKVRFDSEKNETYERTVWDSEECEKEIEKMTIERTEPLRMTWGFVLGALRQCGNGTEEKPFLTDDDGRRLSDEEAIAYVASQPLDEFVPIKRK